MVDSENIRWDFLAREKLAIIYFELSNFSIAEQYYRDLFNIYPKLEKWQEYQFKLSIALFEQRKLKEAEKIFNNIIKYGKHDFEKRAYFYLGLVKFSNKEWQEAISYWKQYLKRKIKKSEIVETKFLLANSYETIEELQKAYDIYYSLLGEYPNSKIIKNRLEAIYKRKAKRRR